MRFEVGKYYKHTSHYMIHVIGRLNTITWGNDVMVAEEIDGGMCVVGEEECNAKNYTEISKTEWNTQLKS